jgi:predicted ABC-type ATPase
VRQGGHNVPEEDIRRRYYAGQRNVFGLYSSIVDVWWIYDASSMPPSLIATEEGGKLEIKQEENFNRVRSGISAGTS